MLIPIFIASTNTNAGGLAVIGVLPLYLLVAFRSKNEKRIAIGTAWLTGLMGVACLLWNLLTPKDPFPFFDALIAYFVINFLFTLFWLQDLEKRNKKNSRR